MEFLAKLLLGDGRFEPELRAALEAEGLVILEEGLPGSIRYRRFKSPGRRFHGKVTPERLALAISAQRLAVYCRSGRVKLIDSSFSEPRLRALDVSLRDGDKVAIRIDFDRAGVPDVSGEITITARTAKAVTIVEHLQARLPR